MSDFVTVYHPELDTTARVAAGSLHIHRENGWIPADESDTDTAGITDFDEGDVDRTPADDEPGDVADSSAPIDPSALADDEPGDVAADPATTNKSRSRGRTSKETQP